ncbi:MAG: Bifunctional NAD(P)H-hydrate repair enzyme Nnr [Candidatus Heimdallarchaeota archaeon LC_2]|nr:MAG: Bifunctional NAD(P)H-hydrate repair enzyme Nnr [Candidatus Heimdallarchaeota archaeon LC_2]
MWQLEDLSLSPVEYITREESLAIETNEFLSGIEAYDLMFNAGKAIAEHVLSLELENIVVIAGSGNNGGDGIVAAGILAKNCKTTLILIKKPKTKEAKKAFRNLKSNKLMIKELDQDIDLTETIDLMKKADLIVDALIGVGLNETVRSPYSEILSEFSNLSDIHVCCVDVPSGLDCNTGNWHSDNYTPNSIVTMEYTKAGLKQFHEKGIIKVAPIGISKKSAFYVNAGHFTNYWPIRKSTSHKGDNGRIIVIGGSDGFTGAPVLSGMSALRAGVDTLRIAVPQTIRDIVAGYAEDFIVLKVKGDKLTTKGFNRFRELLVHRHDVVTMGMGLSNHPECIKFVLELFEYIKGKIRIVLDADAIRAFRGRLDLLQDSGAIITPHRAELRMMLEEKIPENPQELITFLEATATRLGIVILLKGKIDIITNGKRTILNETGHSGMTVGGTGDVLAGLVGAVNCFIEDSFFATAIAANIMGRAGEYSAKKFGNSLLASDVIHEIPRVIMDLESLRE